MKKQFFTWLLCAVLLTSCLGVSAMDAERCLGEVLYHQNFSAVEGGTGGVCLGTSSSAQSNTSCAGKELLVQTYDSGRVYLLLPELHMESDSYTLEFTFRFSAVHKENGFLAPILTSRGTEPSNISSVVLRADGSADHFEPAEAFLEEAAQAGESICVQIPVQNGAVHEITCTTDTGICTLERENVLMINQGRLGFCVRNADVAIEEVYVVCGTGYTEKIGYYADHSYAETAEENALSTCGTAACSPATGDQIRRLLIVCGVALAGGLILGIFFGKRRK